MPQAEAIGPPDASFEGGGRRMGWVGLILLAAGLVALFIVWDLVFCGGKRCKGLIDRL